MVFHIGTVQNCPSCGAKQENRVAAQLNTNTTFSLQSIKPGISLPVHASVCSLCGNVQLYVDQNDFRTDHDIADVIPPPGINELF